MLGAPAGAFLAHIYSPAFVLDTCVYLTALNAAVALIGFRNGRLARKTKPGKTKPGLDPPGPPAKTKLPLGGDGGAGVGLGLATAEGGSGSGGGVGGGGKADSPFLDGSDLFLESGRSSISDPGQPLLLDGPPPAPAEDTGGGAGYDPCSAVALLRNSTALQLISLAVCCYYLAVRIRDA
jgi:hypothetical protein